jgi:hypothetical protein
MCGSRKVDRNMKWLWTILVLLAMRIGAEGITDSASALHRALGDAPLRDQVRNLDHLQSRTRFLEQWNVWMVEFFVEDERIAMLTLNREGEVLERALNRSNEGEFVHRVDELRQELAHAKRIGNEAEVREIQELLKRLERSHPFAGQEVDLEQVLATVHGLGGYGMGLIRWAPFEGVSGIQVVVEREEDGRWVRIESLPLRQGRWIDHDVRVGETVRYRIGLMAPERAFSTKRIIEIVPRQLDDSKMPVYTIQIPKEGLERMLADVKEDIEMDGTFMLNKQRWPMEVRLRGASTRHAVKKSYRIQFKEGSPFSNDVIYLKAEPMDHTLQQEKLSCDLFLQNGLHCSEARYVNLVINGQYQGVYLDIEPIRSPFKKHPGLDPDGVLIRASTFGSADQKPLGDLRGKGDGLKPLETFLKEAQSVSNADFSAWVKENMDWPRVRDYLAMQVLCHRSEIEANDYFFYQDPDTLKWSFVPWDHNNGNFAVAAFENRVLEPRIPVFPQTIQDIGWQPNDAYLIHSRIFRQPDLRLDYLNRLREWTRKWLLEGKIEGLIEANHQQILEAYPVDPYRTPYHEKDPFLSAADDLKTFAKQHGRRLMELIDHALDEPRQVEVDFIQRDADGCRLSLKNVGQEPLSLQNLRFVFKDREKIVRPAWPKTGSLTKGQTIEIAFEEDFRTGGLFCVLTFRGKHDRERAIPLDFCFIPQNE